MYDWANSAYSLVIASAVFPAFYNGVTQVGDVTKIKVFGFTVENTAAYSIALGIAFGIVALISPLLSSISDYSGNQRSFMKFFCYMGALGCISLFFFTDVSVVNFGLISLIIATIGYCGSIVFYNSYLPAIASEENQDKVSARGFTYGYIGATTLLIFNLIFITNPEAFGVEDEGLFPRLSFLLTGLWWIGFAQIPLRKLPKGINVVKTHEQSLMHGYQELLKIWHELKTLPKLRVFLSAFFFYIMGVQTIMFMASSFGEKVMNLELEQLIPTVLLIEYVGIAGAFLFASISKKIGNIPALMIAVSIWILVCIAGYLMRSPMHFYITAVFIGLVMGGIQSLSRSTYAKMIPLTGNNAGYFSFFDVSEKTAMMLGLVTWGVLDNITGNMRNSIFALGAWFIIGLLLLFIMRSIKAPAPTLST